MPDDRNTSIRVGKIAAPHKGILSETDLKILWLARTLSNIELQHESELFRLEQSDTHEYLKKSIKAAMLARYYERRQPYLELLEDLRRQRRQQSLVA
ncbi:MAG TPA: hypothetical protein VEZ16_19050 [Microvirga sp.]|nr:hypothetical protein [Microvirga sp.]